MKVKITKINEHEFEIRVDEIKSYDDEREIKNMLFGELYKHIRYVDDVYDITSNLTRFIKEFSLEHAISLEDRAYSYVPISLVLKLEYYPEVIFDRPPESEMEEHEMVE